MHETHSSENEFLAKLTEIVEANLTNPQFGVFMLAKEMSMSRSNLHRKVNSELKISVSQYINQIRLKNAKYILRHTSDKVSEVAYKVGYNNVSYFIKCLHEFYGYSPGKVGNREENETDTGQYKQAANKKLKTVIISALLLVVIIAALIIVIKPFQFQQNKLKNKIAVLPPDNFDIRDSSYSSDIDGIIQNTINNLSKINEINIVSPWQSVLQYRNKFKPAPEIAKERGVNYVLKPRIHSIQGKVTLSINLIDGPGDKHLETFVYKIDSNNITTVYLDIIKDISKELNVDITPAEQGRINKIITANRKAHKHYWDGIGYLRRFRNKAYLDTAKTCFEKAIDCDDECAPAYAQLARTYFLMEPEIRPSVPLRESLYSKEINYYADKAMRYDPHLDLSLIAKALYYRNEIKFEFAIDYLEEALEYYPNSYLAIKHLFNFYRYTGNSEKSIRFGLKVINSNLPFESTDKELGIEQIYVQLFEQYRSLGLFHKAMEYMDMAIKTNANYIDALCQKSQILEDLDGEENNYKKSNELLLNAINKDSNSICAHNRLGQSYYMLRDYSNANKIYEKWFELSGNNATDFSGISSGRLAVVFKKSGQPKKAQMQIENYRRFGETRSPYSKSYILTGYYSFIGDTAKALEQLKIMSAYDHHPYFRIRLLRDAPLYDYTRELPQFQQILSRMKERWLEKSDSIRVVYKKEGLL